MYVCQNCLEDICLFVFESFGSCVCGYGEDGGDGCGDDDGCSGGNDCGCACDGGGCAIIGRLLFRGFKVIFSSPPPDGNHGKCGWRQDPAGQPDLQSVPVPGVL